MKMSLLCLFGIAVFVGFGEGIEWIIWPTVVAGVLAGGVLLSRRADSGSAYCFHNTTGWSDAKVRLHEQGHYNVATRQGCKARIELNNPGGPVTRVWGGGDLTPVQRAAIAYGGWAKAGSAGIEGDMKRANADLGWSGSHGEAKRIAKRLA